jgi:hypothetical protein
MAEDRVLIPKSKAPPGAPAPKSASPAAREEVDLARILKALQTIESNSADRMRDLRSLLLFLPLIWAAIWGVIYFIILVVTGK